MSGQVYVRFWLGSSFFFSVREPATWVSQSMAARLRVPRSQKDFAGTTRTAGAGIGTSIISAMHRGRLRHYRAVVTRALQINLLLSH
jgi:hypothetical protein